MIDKIRLKTNILEAIEKHKTSLEDIIDLCHLKEYYGIARNQLTEENNDQPTDDAILYRIIDELYFVYSQTNDDTIITACEHKIGELLSNTNINQSTIYFNPSVIIQISTITDISNNTNIQNIIENAISNDNCVKSYDKTADKKTKLEVCLNIIKSILGIIPGIKPALEIIQEVLELFQNEDK